MKVFKSIFASLILMFSTVRLVQSQPPASQSYSLIQDGTKVIWTQSNQNYDIWLHLIKTQDAILVVKSSYSSLANLFFPSIVYTTYDLNPVKIVAWERKQMNCHFLLLNNTNNLSYIFVTSEGSSVTDFNPNLSSDTFQIDQYCRSYRFNSKLYFRNGSIFTKNIYQDVFQIQEKFYFVASNKQLYEIDYASLQFEPSLKIDFQNYSEMHIKSFPSTDPDGRFLQNIIIYGLKTQTLNGVLQFSYKVQIFFRSNGEYYDLIDQINGVSYLNKPIFYFGSQLLKIIIDETKQDQTHKYFGLYIFFRESYTKELDIPLQVPSSGVSFIITSDYLYARATQRDMNNKIWHGVYLISNSEIILQLSQLIQYEDLKSLYGFIIKQKSLINTYLVNNSIIYRNITTLETLEQFFKRQLLYGSDSIYTIFELKERIEQNDNTFVFNQFLHHNKYGSTCLYKNIDPYKYNDKLMLIFRTGQTFQKNYPRSFSYTYAFAGRCYAVLINLDSGYRINIYLNDMIEMRIVQYSLDQLDLKFDWYPNMPNMTVSYYCQFFQFNNYLYKRYDNTFKDVTPQDWDHSVNFQLDQRYNYAIYKAKLYTFLSDEFKPQRLIGLKNQQIILKQQNKIIANKTIQKIIIVSRDPILNLSNVYISYKDLYCGQNEYRTIPLAQGLTSFRVNAGSFTDTINNIDVQASDSYETITFMDLSMRKILIFSINWKTYKITQLNNNTNQIIYSQNPYQLYVFNTNNYIWIQSLYQVSIYKLMENKSSSENQKYFKFITQDKQDFKFYSLFYSVLAFQEDQQHNFVVVYTYLPRYDFRQNLRFVNKTYFQKLDYVDKQYQTGNRNLFVSQSNKKFQFQLCPAGCQSCSNSRVCHSCLYGFTYVPIIFNCLKCQGNCRSCDSDAINECLQCYSGYYLSGKLCLKCHPSCFQCNYLSPSECISCQIGKYLKVEKSKKTCVSCSQNCDKCKNQTTCLVCSYGYGISSKGECLECPLTCMNCDGDEILKCSACKEGFYLLKTQNYDSCRKCIGNCSKCQDSKICLKCFSNYFLDQSSKCRPICQFPCLACTGTDSTQCTSCVFNYKLNSNSSTCEPDLSCNNENKCTSCPYKYRLLFGTCHKCSENEFCLACSKNDSQVCIQCAKGHYILSGQCLECSQQCESCFIDNVCRECKSGYMAVNQGSIQLRCVKCSSNCKTCIYSITNCLSCQENYTLNGSTCAWLRQVGFRFKLSLDYDNLTNQQITNFKTSFASIIQKDVSSIKIQQIQKSSILIFGGVEVKDLEDETNVVKKSLSLSKGSNIGGYNVQSSQFTSSVTIQSQSAKQASQSLLIALAISIPTAIVILISIFAYLLYMRHLRRKQKEAEQQQNQIKMGNSNFSDQQRKKRRAERANKKRTYFLPATSSVGSSHMVNVADSSIQ